MKVWAVRYALERSSIINATVAIRKVNIIAEGDVSTSITFCGVCEQQSCQHAKSILHILLACCHCLLVIGLALC